jgi:hypothetical protein
MSLPAQQKTDATNDTGVADVRRVREKIAAQYNGDLQKHAAETNEIVEPLIERLGLREGLPAPSTERRSGTEG